MIFSKKAIFALIFAVIAISITDTWAQTRLTKEEYVDLYKEIAIDHMERYGIPASITMAQGILESDSGNSNLAKRSNNHFGITTLPMLLHRLIMLPPCASLCLSIWALLR